MATSWSAGVRGRIAREKEWIFEDGQTERDLTFSWYTKDGKSTSEKIGEERNDLSHRFMRAHSFDFSSFIKSLFIRQLLPVAKLLDHRIFRCIAIAIQQ